MSILDVVRLDMLRWHKRRAGLWFSVLLSYCSRDMSRLFFIRDIALVSCFSGLRIVTQRHVMNSGIKYLKEQGRRHPCISFRDTFHPIRISSQCWHLQNRTRGAPSTYGKNLLADWSNSIYNIGSNCTDWGFGGHIRCNPVRKKSDNERQDTCHAWYWSRHYNNTFHIDPWLGWGRVQLCQQLCCLTYFFGDRDWYSIFYCCEKHCQAEIISSPGNAVWLTLDPRILSSIFQVASLRIRVTYFETACSAPDSNGMMTTRMKQEDSWM